MNFLTRLNAAIDQNNSLVCVGLDSDVSKLPPAVAARPEAQLDFNRAIIDATHDLVCAYKLNSAFYEAAGAAGVEQLKQTCDYLARNYPAIPLIIDAKRGDIGNTNDGYIKFIFDYLGVDAVTLHPYLGQESIQPFLDLKDKGMIILCRTSNRGAGEFQDLQVAGRPLYEHVARSVAESWNGNGNCLLVVGATYPAELAAIRQLVGDEMVFLVPGIGAQGGDLEAAMKAGLGAKARGLIINSSRGIIFASSGDDFAAAARTATEDLRSEINKLRK